MEGDLTQEKNIPIKISKKDVEDLFQKPTDSKSTKITKNVFKWLGIFILVIFLGFAFVNGPAIYANAKYFTYVDLLNKPYPSKVIDISASADINLFNENNHLIIPEIGLNSPVQWNTDQSNLKEVLKNGLVHLKESSLPSDPSGNTFIVGYSSYYNWIQNKNSDVFALLHNLRINDKIYLTYNQNIYTYQINFKATIKSSEIEIIKPNNQKQLTLMTYTPIGTNLNKLIIIADQIDSTETITPAGNEFDTKEKFIKNENAIIDENFTENAPTAQATPSPANTELFFLPDIN